MDGIKDINVPHLPPCPHIPPLTFTLPPPPPPPQANAIHVHRSPTLAPLSPSASQPTRLAPCPPLPSLHLSFHARECHAVALLPLGHRRGSSGAASAGSRARTCLEGGEGGREGGEGVREAGEAIIVTGAEDGAVRMMRYASGMEGI